MSDLEDRSFGVIVDGDDFGRFGHTSSVLNGTADTDGDI
jgi:hypothetical protein